MARWPTGTRERLGACALELFAAQGYERTTVAEIAAAAGLTERTFFRNYTDKPEVLFAGQAEFEGLFLTPLENSSGTAPMELVGTALDHAATFFPDDRRAWSRRRDEVVSANAALQERELHKMSSLAAALRAALVERGIEETTASLAAEMAISVFRRAFATWIAPGETRTFTDIQRAVLQRLRGLLSDA